jgi:hypothetical protein
LSEARVIIDFRKKKKEKKEYTSLCSSTFNSLGKYHAAVSCYMGGKVSCNFGPKFKFPLRIGKPLCQASSLVFAPSLSESAPLEKPLEVDEKTLNEMQSTSALIVIDPDETKKENENQTEM